MKLVKCGYRVIGGPSQAEIRDRAPVISSKQMRDRIRHSGRHEFSWLFRVYMLLLKIAAWRHIGVFERKCHGVKGIKADGESRGSWEGFT